MTAVRMRLDTLHDTAGNVSTTIRCQVNIVQLPEIGSQVSTIVYCPLPRDQHSNTWMLCLNHFSIIECQLRT